MSFDLAVTCYASFRELQAAVLSSHGNSIRPSVRLPVTRWYCD